jgi:cytochrome o ubiquinol oxidase subunit 2
MKPYLITIISLGVTGFFCLLIYLAHLGGIPLLTPSGLIGLAERDLMIRTVLLMLIVVVPVFVLIILIAWRYRASNTRAKYSPNWENSPMEEFIWWAIPFEIVLVLGALTWSSTHALAPERPLSSSEAPLTVQVVALPWKWLFIYPEEGVASVNELVLPAGRPVRFQITADAPMNSFWIPALGGQMYAMTGMVTELNLEASHPGNYAGKSANYSGEGFAQMTFTARALSESDWGVWVEHTKHAPDTLTAAEFAALAKPSDAGPVRYYGSMTISFMDVVHSFMPEMTLPASSTASDMSGKPMSSMP